ncbi:MAG TPA: deoxyhypusine synthase family protein [Candidatus Nanoarchaeia archaeon]|nr:deoxyhypusine synthase family protein [Candidatus Nanoarchaeia archaeon]
MEIKQFKGKKGLKVDELLYQYKDLGHQAKKLGEAADIIVEMIKDKECKVFLGLAGALVPGGMRLILKDMIERGWIDVFVTTGANMTHDLAEDLGHKHIYVDEKSDDKELNKKGLDRMYNTAMPNKVYEDIEDLFVKNWDEIEKCKDVKEFLWTIGKITPGDGILKTCYKKKIPIFCPAISDSGIGLMVWGRIVDNKKINVNAFEDLKEILDIAWTAKKTGVIYLGGGTPKNYIQQAMQFSKGASYGVQITMDSAEWGGSSGAPLKEGISWGKLKYKANYVDVKCDVTIALPLIYSALIDRI